MGFNQPATLNLKASIEVAITLFRSATYPVWADRDVGFFQVVDYIFPTLSATTSNTEAMSFSASALAGFATSGPRTATQYTCGFTVPAFANAITKPILGRDEILAGPEWVYVPKGCTCLPVVVSQVADFPGAAGGQAVVNFDVWTGPGESTLTSTSGVITGGRGGVSLSPISPAGLGFWIRPKQLEVALGAMAGTWPANFNYIVSLFVTPGTMAYTSASGTGGTVAVTGTMNATMHIPLTYPVEFNNSQLPWYATRVTASAFLGTNVTQVLNKGGTILAGRVSPAVMGPWSLTSAYVSTLHPAEKAFLPLETGVYTYCPPSTDLAHFTDYTVNTSLGVDPVPLMVLSNDAMYNRLYLTAGSVDESLACTVTWHVEFRTSSALFQIGLSNLTLESLHQAQLILAEHGYFFENINHKAILNRLMSFAKSAFYFAAPDLVKTAHRALRLVAPKTRQPPRKQKNNGRPLFIKPPPGPKTPPTTTAAASGILGPKKKGGLQMYLESRGKR